MNPAHLNSFIIILLSNSKRNFKKITKGTGKGSKIQEREKMEMNLKLTNTFARIKFKSKAKLIEFSDLLSSLKIDTN